MSNDVSSNTGLPQGYTEEPITPSGASVPSPQAHPATQPAQGLPSGYTEEPIAPSVAAPSGASSTWDNKTSTTYPSSILTPWDNEAPRVHDTSTFSGKLAQMGDDIANGALQAASKTAAGLAKLGSYHATSGPSALEYVSDKVGDILGLPHLPTGVSPYDAAQAQAAQQSAAAQKTTGGVIGEVGENVAEYALGEGELKALTGGAKLMEVAKMTKLLEQYPEVKTAVETAMKLKALQMAGRVARVSAIQAVQGGLHAAPNQVGQEMARGAEYGAAGGALGEAAGAGAEALKARTAEGMSAAAEAEFLAHQKASNQALSDLSVKGTDSVENVAKKAAINAGATTTEDDISNPYHFDNAAFDIKASAKPVFTALDKESNGAFETIRTRIDNAKQIIRNGASSIDALEQAQNALKVGNDQMESLFNSSKISRADLDGARNAWYKASTLEDLHDGLDKAYATSSVVQPSQAAAFKQSLKDMGIDPNATNITIQSNLDPKKFSARFRATVDKIGRKRLFDALGDEGINDLDEVDREFRTAVASQKNQQALTRAMYAAAAKAPKGSPLNTLGYELLATAGGAGVGAGYGAATSTPENRISGALTGAEYGAAAGAAVGIPAAIVHFMYTHPKPSIAILKGLKPLAVPASIGANVTHRFDENTGTVIPVDQQ